MRRNFQSYAWSDKDENPAGGTSFGEGFTISWQNGPLGRNEQREQPNGAFVETIIAAARDRLQFYQEGKFNSKFNREAIDYLTLALDILDKRTQEREHRGVEGTHVV